MWLFYKFSLSRFLIIKNDEEAELKLLGETSVFKILLDIFERKSLVYLHAYKHTYTHYVYIYIHIHVKMIASLPIITLYDAVIIDKDDASEAIERSVVSY